MKKIVLENFDEGNDNYKINLFYLNREQVEEIKDIVSKWNHTKDEKMIRRIIEALQRYMPTDELWEEQEMVAWLEKQGQSKPTIPYKAIKEGVAHFGITQYQIDNWLKKYVDVEGEEQSTFEQCKQEGDRVVENPDGTHFNLSQLERVAKVEPKFKQGDWVVWDNKISCHIDNVYRGKESLMYTITDANNMTRGYSVKGFDNNAHFWTIKDAKDGDVLVHNDCIFIFMEIKDGIVKGICTELSDTISNFGKLEYNNDYCPATKEQRDALMRVINDSGYEWDSEKKVLKKIEQQSEKSKWTEEDEKNWLGIMDEIEANKSNAPDYDIETYDRYLCWLESLKQRIL